MLACLREFNMASVVLRLCLAVFCGGLIGLERERKRRAAGFRTYMLVALGATLAMLLGQYALTMLERWSVTFPADFSTKTDVGRLGAQVINGIGFLGAGTIIVNTDKQQVQGLTTAAGLWACGCMGLAIGAGFYACVIIGVALIFLCMRLLYHVEGRMMETSRSMNLYVEFASMDDVAPIILALKAQGAQICEVELSHGRKEQFRTPSAVISLRLREKRPHPQIIASMMDLECVRFLEEI